MAKKASPKTVQLLEAVVENDLAGVKRLCENGADPCKLDPVRKRRWGANEEPGVAPLHAAFFRNVQPAIADYLLTRPHLDINLQSSRKRTPLYYVLSYRKGAERLDLVRRLLALGADPNIPDDLGNTAINEIEEDFELLDVLVQGGADVSFSHQGWSVLDRVYNDVGEFHRFPDKPHFVRFLHRLLELGAKSEIHPMKRIRDWLETTGAKYMKDTPPERVRKESAARAKFEAITARRLDELAGKRVHLTVEGESEPVALFDWYVFLDEKENDESSSAAEIESYHIPMEFRTRVQAEKLVPFGVVGMTGSFDSYEEMGIDGTLFLDLSRAGGSDAPIVFTPSEDEPRPLADSYAALMKTAKIGGP
jgi:hypothetical protein